LVDEKAMDIPERDAELWRAIESLNHPVSGLKFSAAHDLGTTELAEIRRPKGRRECLEEAAGYVLPYLVRGAKCLWGAYSDPPKEKLSTENLKDWLVEIAGDFNEESYRYKHAARLSSALKQLKNLQECARNLAQVISELNRETLNAIEACLSPDSLPEQYNSAEVEVLCRIAQASAIEESLLHRIVWGPEVTAVSWIDRLEALWHVAGLVSEILIDQYGGGDRSQPDTGGPNLYHKDHGHPIWHFVFQSAQIFETARPDEITPSLSGPFSSFTHSLFAYASGLESEDDTRGLGWRIEQVCTLVNRLRRQNSRLVEIETERRTLCQSPSAEQTKESRRRLRREFISLVQQQLSLLDTLETGRPRRKQPPRNSKG